MRRRRCSNARDESCARGAQCRRRQGRRCIGQAGDERGARRHHPQPGRRQGCRQDRGHRGDPRPRRPGCACAAWRPAGRAPRAGQGRPPHAAVSSIQNGLALWSGVQNAWYGLSLGSVLLLAAIGLAITFGVMGVINMAHGEMVMLGAYTTFVVQETHPHFVIRVCSTGRWRSPCRSPSWSPGWSASLWSARSSAFCMAGRWRRCLPPGACRWCCSRPCAPSSARPTERSARHPG